MSKAMFGIAGALALAMSPAWAGDEKSDEATKDTIVPTKSETKARSASERATARVVDADRDSAAMRESNEVRASESHEARWLREREGYRDGGY